MKIELTENITEIVVGCFFECSNLQEITLPKSVTKLGERCFFWCINLTKIVLNENIKEIPRSCFLDCHNLKEITIPEVVNKIIEHHITHCHFEANNGGDMYAEKVQEELKNKGIKWCNVTWSKVPTTKSKLDRILASAGAIRGSERSDYRLMIKRRTAIKNHAMYNLFLDLLFKFNQSLKMQGKQADDVPDSLANLFQNVLGCKADGGVVHSHYSRQELGI